MERIEWVDYKGKRILRCDYSGLLGEKHVEFIEEVKKTMSELPAGTELLVLADVTGTHTTARIKEKYEELTAIRDRFGGHDAAIGITGLMRIIANVVKKDIYFGKSEQDAKEWLVSH